MTNMDSHDLYGVDIPDPPEDEVSSMHGSSARKAHFQSLYARGEVTATEMLDLHNGLERRIREEARAQMSFGAKVAEFVVKTIIAGLGGQPRA
jgi:hypothetical protein